MNPKQHPLTRDAQIDLQEFLNSASGQQVMRVMQQHEPVPVAKDGDPIATMAISGAETAGWKKCLRRLRDLSIQNP